MSESTKLCRHGKPFPCTRDDPEHRDSPATPVADIRRPVGCPTSEYSTVFLQGMVDRMAMSYFKYGAVADAYPGKVNALESLQKRIDRYLETGNTEWLIDVANYAMIEFMRPAHPRAHYRATDSAESPGRFATDKDEHVDSSNYALTDVQWRELRESHSETPEDL